MPGQPGQHPCMEARLGAPTPGGQAARTFEDWTSQRLGARLTPAPSGPRAPSRRARAAPAGNGGSAQSSRYPSSECLSSQSHRFRLETSHRPRVGQEADLILETPCLPLVKVPINIQDDSPGRKGIKLRAVSHGLSHQGPAEAGGCRNAIRCGLCDRTIMALTEVPTASPAAARDPRPRDSEGKAELVTPTDKAPEGTALPQSLPEPLSPEPQPSLMPLK